MSDEKEITRGLFPRERGLLSEFQFDVVETLNANIPGGVLVTITLAQGDPPVVIAELAGPTALNIDDVTDRVWLTGTVGWTVTVAPATIQLTVFRNAPITGPIVTQVQDTRTAVGDSGATSFNHVDIPLTVPGPTEVPYFLTASAATGTLTITGPITLTGAEIERNRICNP